MTRHPSMKISDLQLGQFITWMGRRACVVITGKHRARIAFDPGDSPHAHTASIRQEHLDKAMTLIEMAEQDRSP